MTYILNGKKSSSNSEDSDDLETCSSAAKLIPEEKDDNANPNPIENIYKNPECTTSTVTSITFDQGESMAKIPKVEEEASNFTWLKRKKKHNDFEAAYNVKRKNTLRGWGINPGIFAEQIVGFFKFGKKKKKKGNTEDSGIQTEDAEIGPETEGTSPGFDSSPLEEVEEVEEEIMSKEEPISEKLSNHSKGRLGLGGSSSSPLLGGAPKKLTVRQEAEQALKEASESNQGPSDKSSTSSSKSDMKASNSKASSSILGSNSNFTSQVTSKSEAGGKSSKKSAPKSFNDDLKVQNFSTKGFSEPETAANAFASNAPPDTTTEDASGPKFGSDGKPKGWRKRALCKLGVLYFRGCPNERPHPKKEKEQVPPSSPESEEGPIDMEGQGSTSGFFSKVKSSLSSLSSKIGSSMSRIGSSSKSKMGSKGGGGSGGSSVAANRIGSSAGLGPSEEFRILGGGSTASGMGSSIGGSGSSLFSPSSGGGRSGSAIGKPAETKAPDRPPPPPPRAHKYPSAFQEYCEGGLPEPPGPEPTPLDLEMAEEKEKNSIFRGMKGSMSRIGSGLRESMSKLSQSVSKMKSSMSKTSRGGSGSGSGSKFEAHLGPSSSDIGGWRLMGGQSSEVMKTSSSGINSSGSNVKAGSGSGLFGKLSKSANSTDNIGSGSGSITPDAQAAIDAEKTGKPPPEPEKSNWNKDGGWIKEEDYKCMIIPYMATFSQPLRRRWRIPKYLECKEPKVAKEKAPDTADYFPEAADKKKSGVLGSLSSKISSLSTKLSSSLSSLSKSMSKSMSGSGSGMGSGSKSGGPGSGGGGGGGSGPGRLGIPYASESSGRLLGGQPTIIEVPPPYEIEGPNRLGCSYAKYPVFRLLGGADNQEADGSKKRKKRTKHRKKKNAQEETQSQEPKPLSLSEIHKIVPKEQIKSKSRKSMSSARSSEIRLGPMFRLSASSSSGSEGGLLGGLSSSSIGGGGSGLGSKSIGGGGSGTGLSSTSMTGPGSGAGSSGGGQGVPYKTGCRYCHTCPFSKYPKRPGYLSDIVTPYHWQQPPPGKKPPRVTGGGPTQEEIFAQPADEPKGGLLSKFKSSLSSLSQKMSSSMSNLASKSGIGGKKSKSQMGD